jgi:hypothetical protein
MVGALAVSAAAPARAQGGRRTALAVTGLPFTVTQTTPSDFDAGSVILGTLTFTVDATANTPVFSPRATTVNVRCFAPCPASGTLNAAALQWRRGDLGTWNTLTTTLALVETRNVTFNGANDPWSNTIQFRYLLSWAGTPPTAATQFRVELELVVAAP